MRLVKVSVVCERFSSTKLTLEVKPTQKYDVVLSHFQHFVYVKNSGKKRITGILTIQQKD